MPNLYASLLAFRRRHVGGQPLEIDDEGEVLRVLEAIARAVDDFCERRFYVETATRVYNGNGRDRLRIPPLISASSVKLDEDTDGTFELTLTEDTDFWLRREGHQDPRATPSTIIILNPYQGSRTAFLNRPELIEIVGEWGWSNDTETLGGGVTATLADATATKMTTTKAGNPPLGPGDTVLVESERLFIEGGEGQSKGASNWKVVRGVNGSTAAAHSSKALTRYVYEPRLVEAVLLQSSALWKRRQSEPGFWTIEQFKGLDPDVQRLLNPLREFVVV